MSFLRYLTVHSFRKYNPDWTIKIHVPTVVCGSQPSWDSFEQKHSNVSQDFFYRIMSLGVEIVKHDFEQYGFKNDVHEVYKADFIRWKMLAEEGGLWSDADIIYTKPVTDLVENVEENKDVEVVLCAYPSRLHAIGFLMSSPNNIFFKHISEMAKEKLDLRNYQSIGCVLFNDYYRTKEIIEEAFPVKCLFLHSYCVYSLNHTAIDFFYNKVVDITKAPPGAVGFHWYAGHPSSQQYENLVTNDNYGAYNNTMKLLIRQALT